MENNYQIHPVVYLERKCKCGKYLKCMVYDYGVLRSLNEVDEKVGDQNFTIVQIECPNCGLKEFPTHLAMYNKLTGQLISKGIIGTEEIPVCSNESIPYGTVRSHEEEEQIARGWAKLHDFFKKNEETFWEKYCAFGLSNWKQNIKEFNLREISKGFEILGLTPIQDNASLTVWRREVISLFSTEEEKKKAWKALNHFIIYEDFLYIRPDTWPIKDFIKEYGRNRVQFIVMNIPLPEELEKCRTEVLAKVIKKKSGEAGVLFERIGQLGQELDRQRNRSQALSQTLMELKQEKGLLETKLNKAYEQINTLKQEQQNNIEQKIPRNPKDVQKIKSLKGLILELRERVEELERLHPQQVFPEEKEQVTISAEDKHLPVKENNIDPAIVLKGKTIGIFGFRGEPVNDEYKVRWNPGDRVDYELEALARESNVFVVITRFISHAAMWRLKELAIDYDVPIVFLKETGLKRILDEVALIYKK